MTPGLSIYNPLNLDINMHVLLTVVYMFHMIHTWENLFKHQHISSLVIINFHSHFQHISSVSDIVRIVTLF